MSRRLTRPIRFSQNRRSCSISNHESFTVPRYNPREFHRDIDYEDTDNLAKQKYDLVNEIRELKNELKELSVHHELCQNQRDDDELLEIDYFKRYSQEEMSNQKLRVLYFSQKLTELQQVSHDLDKQIEFFNKYFSDEAERKLRTELALQKHTFTKLREEVSMFSAVNVSATDELISPDLSEGIQTCDTQKLLINKMEFVLHDLGMEEERLLKEVQYFHKTYKPDDDDKKKELEKHEHQYRSLMNMKRVRQHDLESQKKICEHQKTIIADAIKEKQLNEAKIKERNSFAQSFHQTKLMRTQQSLKEYEEQKKKKSRKSSQKSTNGFEDTFDDQNNQNQTEQFDSNDTEKSYPPSSHPEEKTQENYQTDFDDAPQSEEPINIGGEEKQNIESDFNTDFDDSAKQQEPEQNYEAEEKKESEEGFNTDFDESNKIETEEKKEQEQDFNTDFDESTKIEPKEPEQDFNTDFEESAKIETEEKKETEQDFNTDFDESTKIEPKEAEQEINDFDSPKQEIEQEEQKEPEDFNTDFDDSQKQVEPEEQKEPEQDFNTDFDESAKNVSEEAENKGLLSGFAQNIASNLLDDDEVEQEPDVPPLSEDIADLNQQEQEQIIPQEYEQQTPDFQESQLYQTDFDDFEPTAQEAQDVSVFENTQHAQFENEPGEF